MDALSDIFNIYYKPQKKQVLANDHKYLGSPEFCEEKKYLVVKSQSP